ncbi:MAG: GatB/YqeY domain-containing protein [Lentimicrobium sp.]|nr:GatB/YqeY domain-containing protein [Lentimicrobium sp.]
MSLTDKINDDIKKAMLAREKDKLEALRAVKSALLLLKTSESGSDITEDDEIKLLQKLVKQRRETAEIYAGQNRPDLAEAEKFQAEAISVYLPSQLSPEELKPVIQDIIQSTGATGIKDMGKVMAAASQQLAGKADNKTISMIVKELLGL